MRVICGSTAARKHGVTFQLASTVFHDQRLLTDADPAATNIRGLMSNQPIDDNDTPAEIAFSKGVRGLHHIPPGAEC